MLHVSQFSKLSIFRDVPLADLTDMARDVQVHRVPKGHIVVDRGESGSDVFLVMSGHLVGVLIAEDGKEVAYATIAENSVFGEMAALDGRPRSLTVQAATECLIGRVSGPAFNRWIDASPMIARNLLHLLVDRTRRLNDRVFELVVHDVETRVRLMLVRMAMEEGALEPGAVIDPAPSHSVIASHVGANREAVSRVMSRLTKSGVLESGRKRIALKDIEVLVAGL
ncbi:MAG: Crp/Fnr family transcriptional regulator [Qingshengfaniella sp.]